MSEQLSRGEQVINSESLPDRQYVRFSELGIGESPQERIAQLHDITAEGIIRFSTRIHEVVTPEISHLPHTGAMRLEARDGTTTKYLMEPEQRLLHFEHAANLIIGLVGMEANDDHTRQAILTRVGNVLALAVVQTHTFKDGNGRTARTIAQLVREGVGEQDSEAFSDLLQVSKNRPTSGFRMYSFLPINEGIKLSPNEVLDQAAALDIPLKDQSAYEAQKSRTFMSPFKD